MTRFPLLARAVPPLVGLVVLVAAASLARRPFRSFDTYFHLRFGEEFLGSWSIGDPGRVTSAGSNDWVPTQWLSQIGLTLTERAFGADGLAVLFVLLLVGLALSMYLLGRQAGGPVVASLTTAAALLGSLGSLSLRPQLVSYVLVVVTIAGWLRARRTGKVPWWLVPMGWAWAVSHGMWILGIAISLVLAAAVILERRPRAAGAAQLLAVPVGMLVAACLTPVGPRLLSAVVLVSSRADHFLEWRAPELATLAVAPLTALAAVAVLLSARRGGLTPFELAMLGLAGGFAVYSSRTLPVAACFLVWCVCSEVQRLRTDSTQPAVGRRELTATLAAGALTVAVAPLLPADREEGDASEISAFQPRLQVLDEGTVVYTGRRHGSAMLWTNAGLDVPIHGYGDVYTDAELDAYDDLALLEPGWEETLRDLGAGLALLEVDDRVAYALAGAGWQVVQEDDDLVLLAAPAGWSAREPGQDAPAATQRSRAD